MSRITRIGDVLSGQQVERDDAALLLHAGEPLTMRRSGTKRVPALPYTRLVPHGGTWFHIEAPSREKCDEIDAVLKEMAGDNFVRSIFSDPELEASLHDLANIVQGLASLEGEDVEFIAPGNDLRYIGPNAAPLNLGEESN